MKGRWGMLLKTGPGSFYGALAETLVGGGVSHLCGRNHAGPFMAQPGPLTGPGPAEDKATATQCPSLRQDRWSQQPRLGSAMGRAVQRTKAA